MGESLVAENLKLNKRETTIRRKRGGAIFEKWPVYVLPRVKVVTVSLVMTYIENGNQRRLENIVPTLATHTASHPRGQKC